MAPVAGKRLRMHLGLCLHCAARVHKMHQRIGIEKCVRQTNRTSNFGSRRQNAKKKNLFGSVCPHSWEYGSKCRRQSQVSRTVRPIEHPIRSSSSPIHLPPTHFTIFDFLIYGFNSLSNLPIDPTLNPFLLPLLLLLCLLLLSLLQSHLAHPTCALV